MKQLKKTKDSLVLTVNEKAGAVQDATAYQHALDIAAHADAREGIRQGLGDVAQGRTRHAADFFRDFEARLGPSR